MSGSSDRTKFVVWRERLERFPRSGLTVVGFCVREGVSAASFYYWRKKMRLEGRQRRVTDGHPLEPPGPIGGRGHFRRVAVVPAVSGMAGSVPAVCIQLPGGTRMEVGAADLDSLRAVVAEVMRADRGREAGVARC